MNSKRFTAMNKVTSIAYGLLLNIFGYSLLIAPAMVFLEIYSQYAEYYSYFAYSVLSLYALIYFSGAVKCNPMIARAIAIELRSNDTVLSYLPVVSVLIMAILVLINSNYYLGLLMLFPLVLNFISRYILFYKAKV